MTEVQLPLFFFGGAAFGMVMTIKHMVGTWGMYQKIMYKEFKEGRLREYKKTHHLEGFSRGRKVEIFADDSPDLLAMKREYLSRKEGHVKRVFLWYVVAFTGGALGIGLGILIYGMPS